MTRPWPINLARAWLLRKAAEMVERGGSGAAVSEVLIEVADADSAMLCDEHGFAQLLKLALSMGRENIARAVAEVYGEAPTPLRPAADVVLEMVSEPEFDSFFKVWRCRIADAYDYVPLEYQQEENKESADGLVNDARALLTCLIDRSRAEGAAAAQARIAELEAAVREARGALQEFEACAGHTRVGREAADAFVRALDVLRRVGGETEY